MVENERDLPKPNIWCETMMNKVEGPSFFNLKSITGDIYMPGYIYYFVILQSQDVPNTIFKLNSAPPHWFLDVWDYLNKHFPVSCI